MGQWLLLHAQMYQHKQYWYHRSALVVPEDSELWRRILQQYHDHPLSGHPRVFNINALVAWDFWWPNMRKFVKQYIKGCTICQSIKAATYHPQIPLYPITATRWMGPFEIIALDLIVALPTLQGHDSILTITNHHCSKAALFFPCSQSIDALGVAQIYATQVFPHYGIPHKVISDQDTRFTVRFSTELCRLLDIKQNISTTYHP